MLFRKNTNQTTVELLAKENKRLKRENYRLQTEMDELNRYRKEYKELLENVSGLKIRYSEQIAKLDEILESYKKERR